MTYRSHFSTRQTAQSEPIPGKRMVKNSAGGYVFGIDKWQRLDRFLILGSDKPTYYASAKKLTVENATAVMECIAEDGARVVNRIVEISDSGRAPKNDPALFALAMCAGADDVTTRQAALEALPKVARIGTHLFHFLEYVEGFRGWGRALKRAVADWYNSKPVDKLAYQVVKYQQRDGWRHRDALRLAHPRTNDEARNGLYKWITKGYEGEGLVPTDGLVSAFELAKKVGKDQVISLIKNFNLTHEMIPNEWLRDPDIWTVLLEKMPLTAMIRNLGRMTAIGTIGPMSYESDLVAKRLTDAEYIKKSRVHPLSVLVALRTYTGGKGVKGSLSWSPVARVVDALDQAFYLSFGNAKSSGKRIMLALDVSRSMMCSYIAGLPITPREASAAMALITANVEPNHMFMAFSNTFVSLSISPRQRLDDVIRTISGLPFSGTDCALPMLYALEKNVEVDDFIIFTDNETWAGRIHPVQALDIYKQRTGIDAKLVTVGMTTTGFSIADPDRSDMLDVVGFDTATPQVIEDFITG